MRIPSSLLANAAFAVAVLVGGAIWLTPQFVDYYGKPSMLEAAKRNDYSSVEWWLSMGVDVNSIDVHGRTALHTAAINGSLPLVVLLLENNADPQIRDDQDKAPLNWAVRANHRKIAARLMRNGAEIGFDHPRDLALLSLAAANGNSELTHLMIEAGLDVNYPTSRYRYFPIHRAVASEDLATVRILVDNGATLNVRDGRGRTPFSIADYRQNAEITDYLVSCH